MSSLKKILRGATALSGLLISATAFAQTATTTPGVPTTAVGGNWIMDTILLALGVLIISFGIVFFMDKKRDEKKA